MVGTRFYTSRPTLKADPSCLLAAMLEPGSPMRPFRHDENNSPVYFLDRDPRHFIHILNYLKNISCWSAHVLPNKLCYLYELRMEAEHYMIQGLVEILTRRIALLTEAHLDT